MKWQIEVPLLTNRFVMTDVVVGFGATILICWLMMFLAFAWGNDFRNLGEALRVSSIFALGGAIFLSTISLFVLLVFFGNRHPLEFILDEDGVVMNNISERAKAVHRLAWLMALATGRPLMAGPGAISSTIVWGTRYHTVAHLFGFSVAIALFALCCWGLFRMAPWLVRLLGQTGINVITRSMGLLLMALGIEFIVTGIKSIFPGLLA